MSQVTRSLRVRIGADFLDLPLAAVARVGLLDRVSWSGFDALGGPLLLAQTDHGPVTVLSAAAFFQGALPSPEPAWAVVPGGHEQPVLAFAVCEVLGFVQSQSPAVLSRTLLPTVDPLSS